MVLLNFIFVNLIILSQLIIGSVKAKKFIMGYLTGSQRKPGDEEYSRPGLQISGAISLAVTEINTLQPLINNHTLDFIVAETFGDESESIQQTAKLWINDQVSAYIGPQETCVHEARMAVSFNLPMISYFCAHPETSNKKIFSTFARTRPPDTQISKSVASVLLKFGWHKVTILYSESSDRDFSAVARTIQMTLKVNNIKVQHVESWKETFHYGYIENPFREIVDRTHTNARIYVVIGFYFEHLGLMLSLEEKGLLKTGEYFVVGVDIEQYDREHPFRYFKGLLRESNEIEEVAEKAFRSYIGVVPSPSMGFDDFQHKVNQYMQMPPFNFPNPIRVWGGLKRVPAEGAYLYDAVYVYARALNDTLINGLNASDGRVILGFIKNKAHMSAMGYLVNMDENGDAEGNYTLIARKPRPNNSKKYGLYPIGIFQMPDKVLDLPVLYLTDSIDWVNGMSPLAEPICGFHGENCSDTPWRWAFILSGVILVFISFILYVVYRNWMYEQELDSLLWKIDYRDLILSDYTPTNTKLHNSSQISLTSATELMEFRYCTVYTQIGLYKNRLVAIKKIHKKSVEITRNMKKEMKIMKDLRHDNLNAFIGACIDAPNICIISDYCARGSIKDILQNEDVHLDNMFIASMIGDIIRGMIFIHESSIVSHGNLKSSNCLIDSRWIVKITDFGFHELKMHADNGHSDTNNSEQNYEKLLCRAPELIRDANSHTSGTQKGDVYSFAIILHELITRKSPWSNSLMNSAEIVRRIISDNNDKPFRPSLSSLEAMNFGDRRPLKIPECCITVMKQCWAENPDDRPDFKTLRNRLRPLSKGLKNNILDNMLDMMERYTTNLEAIVDERTEQLVQEKKKTDQLLYEMLPRAVADSLKRGQMVEAESFEAVTVLFSDVVGFTKLSAQSTPLEIVNFLNDLYTLFDSILESYDIYKVETIGDSYMVVSGLPIRNGDRHASEIASMALDLLEAVQKFKIKHRPDTRLLMRIGIHTGPVCAGVVGMKMPRYCLFGDTVNTAARMESTSEPLKIHCTEEFKNILDKLKGYILIERGIVSVKGKGEMNTFWLIGECEQRKVKRKINIFPEITKSIGNNNLFTLKITKPVYTPEMKGRYTAVEMLRYGSPRIERSGSADDKEIIFNTLLPLYNKSIKYKGLIPNSSQTNLRDESSIGIPMSKSQTSLDVISNTINFKNSKINLSPNIVKEIEIIDEIEPPSYKSLERSKRLDNLSTLKVNHLESNELTLKRTNSLPLENMQCNIERSKTLTFFRELSSPKSLKKDES